MGCRPIRSLRPWTTRFSEPPSLRWVAGVQPDQRVEGGEAHADLLVLDERLQPFLGLLVAEEARAGGRGRQHRGLSVVVEQLPEHGTALVGEALQLAEHVGAEAALAREDAVAQDLGELERPLAAALLELSDARPVGVRLLRRAGEREELVDRGGPEVHCVPRAEKRAERRSPRDSK